FGRELSFFWPGVSLWVELGAIGMLSHLTVWMGMAAVGLIRLGRLAMRQIRRVEPAGAPAMPERREALERIGGAVAFAASGAVLGWGAARGRFEWVVEEVPIRLAR